MELKWMIIHPIAKEVANHVVIMESGTAIIK
jgi:hypothetical protein